MSAELNHTATPRAPVRSWKFYPAYSGVEWMGEPHVQDRKALVILQTGLTGSTGCALYFNPVHPVILSRIKKPQMNADERRYLPVRGFIEELNKITHRKGRKERKAEQQKSLRPLRSLRLIDFNRIMLQEAAR